MSTAIHTLCWYLHSLALEKPCLPLLGDKGGWISAEQAEQFVETGAGLLYASGLRSGDRVVLPAGRSVNAVLALLCLQRVGAAAVLIDPRSSPERALSGCNPPLFAPFRLEAGGQPASRSPADPGRGGSAAAPAADIIGLHPRPGL